MRAYVFRRRKREPPRPRCRGIDGLGVESDPGARQRHDQTRLLHAPRPRSRAAARPAARSRSDPASIQPRLISTLTPSRINRGQYVVADPTPRAPSCRAGTGARCRSARSGASGRVPGVGEVGGPRSARSTLPRVRWPENPGTMASFSRARSSCQRPAVQKTAQPSSVPGCAPPRRAKFAACPGHPSGLA